MALNYGIDYGAIQQLKSVSQDHRKKNLNDNNNYKITFNLKVYAQFIILFVAQIIFF